MYLLFLTLPMSFCNWYMCTPYFMGKYWEYWKWHNLVPQLFTWWVVIGEDMSHMANKHSFTNHNSSCGELWHKVVPFLVVLAQLYFMCQMPLLPRWALLDRDKRVSSGIEVEKTFLHPWMLSRCSFFIDTRLLSILWVTCDVKLRLKSIFFGPYNLGLFSL